MTVLSLSGLCKSYDGVPALRDVALDLRGHEIHALMGENGAGKSTLIRILAGVTAPDQVTATVNGAALTLGSPAAAERAGFRFLHQELNIVPALSVAENMLLAYPTPRRFGVAVDWRRVDDRATAALRRFGIDWIDPRTRAGRLAVGDRMLMRLAALVVAGATPPSVFVLDEPTAALTRPEVDRLFGVLRQLRAEGASILYVSHRIEEVMVIADRVTILRDGRNVRTASVVEMDHAAIVQAMTGSADRGTAAVSVAPQMHRKMVLQLTRVSSPALADLNFTLAAGEVLGIAGLEDAGQSDLLRLCLGDGQVTQGTITYDGQSGARTPVAAWARGVVYVPRERRAEGLMMRRGIVANTVLPHLVALSRGGVMRAGAEWHLATDLAKRVRLRFVRMSQPVRTLSGGNQQKVLFARAIGARVGLLLLDDPTRGVDVGARADIHALIRGLAADGAAVLVASTDLPELITLSDRILILHSGRQHGIISAAGLTPDALLSKVYAAERRAGAA